MHVSRRSVMTRAQCALVVLASAGAFREDLTVEPSKPPRDLDSPNTPRDVHVLIVVNRLSGVNLLGQRFKLDFYICFSWRDDRQKLGRIPTDDTVWWPRPEIMNWEGGTPFHTGNPFNRSCAFRSGSPRFTHVNSTEGTWCMCQGRFWVRSAVSFMRSIRARDARI